MYGQWAVAALLASACCSARAQVYKFEAMPIPSVREMKGLYTFYIAKSDEGNPSVTFADLQATLDPEVAQHMPFPAAEYEGLQVSLMKWSSFQDLVNPVQFCSCRSTYWKNDLVLQIANGERKENIGVFDVGIPMDSAAKQSTHEMKDPGVYVLMFTNCGNFTRATVTGSVAVKQAYGYLPGNEYRKLSLYMIFFGVYAVIGFVWCVLCGFHCDEILPIQKGIALLVVLGTAEVAVRYMMLFTWNTTGELQRSMLNVSILLAMWKRVLSFILVLATSQGWGVLTPDLSCGTKVKMALAAVVYTVLSSIQEVVLTFRFSHMLNSLAVMGGSAPTEIMHTTIVMWILYSLTRSIEELAGYGESQRLQMFTWLRRIIISVMAVGGLTVCFEFYEMYQPIGARWEVDWFARAGVSHILFVWILVAMMFLWAPGARSKGYGYVPTQLDADNQDELDCIETPGAPNAEEEEYQPGPSKIGHGEEEKPFSIE